MPARAVSHPTCSPAYLVVPLSKTRQGLDAGSLVKGAIRIHKTNYREAYVPVDSIDKDILIQTMEVSACVRVHTIVRGGKGSAWKKEHSTLSSIYGVLWLHVHKWCIVRSDLKSDADEPYLWQRKICWAAISLCPPSFLPFSQNQPQDRNRALQGDIVVLELLPKDQYDLLCASVFLHSPPLLHCRQAFARVVSEELRACLLDPK